MSDLVDRLRYQHEHGMFDAYNCGMAPNLGEAADRITQLEADRAELVEALRPMANRGGKLDGAWLSHEAHWTAAYGSTVITIGDLRRAYATLAKMEARP